MSGLQRLISLFANPFQRAWQQLQEFIRLRTERRAPKNCRMVGFVGGITARTRGKDGKILRGTIHVTTDEAEGVEYARKSRSPHLPPPEPIPVWRYVWPQNDRKSKHNAKA